MDQQLFQGRTHETILQMPLPTKEAVQFQQMKM